MEIDVFGNKWTSECTSVGRDIARGIRSPRRLTPSSELPDIIRQPERVVSCLRPS